MQHIYHPEYMGTMYRCGLRNDSSFVTDTLREVRNPNSDSIVPIKELDAYHVSQISYTFPESTWSQYDIKTVQIRAIMGEYYNNAYGWVDAYFDDGRDKKQVFYHWQHGTDTTSCDFTKSLDTLMTSEELMHVRTLELTGCADPEHATRVKLIISAQKIKWNAE